MHGDKKQAKSRRWRTPEAVLLTVALAGGSLGILLAMLLFHHKTLHPLFSIGIPLLLLLQTAALFWEISG